MSSTVDHPPHYNALPAQCECGKPIECIQVVEVMGFCIGNAVKYLWRAEHKGNALQDLQKALWYINREVEKRTKQVEEG